MGERDIPGKPNSENQIGRALPPVTTIGGTAHFELGIEAERPEPLPEFVQEMAKDIESWFNPRHGWRVQNINMLYINENALRELFNEVFPDRAEPRETRPDQLAFHFYLKASQPPLKRKFRGEATGLDFPAVFTKGTKRKVHFTDDNSAVIDADSVGNIHRFDRALEELSSAYYLHVVTARPDRDRPESIYDAEGNPKPEKPPKPAEPFPKNVTVFVVTRDLQGRLQREEEDIRKVRREIAIKHGMEIEEEPEQPVVPIKTETPYVAEPDEPDEDKTEETEHEERPEQKQGVTIEPGVYRFSLKDHMWHADIETGISRIEEPPVTFDDIGGLGEVKGGLQLMVEGIKNPDLFAKWGTRPPRGILLYGPPGTGKTMIAKALANEAGVPFFSLSFTDVASRWVHHTAENVKAVLEALDKIEGKKIVFIDEFDNVAVSREEFPPTPGGGSSKKANELLNPLLEYMDGFRSTHNTIFVAATNRKDDIDEAMLRPGRFDRQYHVRLPRAEEIDEVFDKQITASERQAGRQMFAEEIDYDKVRRLARGYSGADVAEVIRRVLENRVADSLQGNESQEPVSTEEILSEMAHYERKQEGERQIGFRTGKY